MNLSGSLFAAVLAAQALTDEAARPGAKVAALPSVLVSSEYLLLPRVIFRDANFTGALEYFRRKAAEHSGGSLKLRMVNNLPENFLPRHELTLDLDQIPFTAALNYLGELAGVQFSIQGTSVFANPLPPGSGPRPLAVRGRSEPKTNLPVKGLTGRLAVPAWPVYVGRNVYRSADGGIDRTRSGYIPHRTLDGLPIKECRGGKLRTNGVKP